MADVVDAGCHAGPGRCALRRLDDILKQAVRLLLTAVGYIREHLIAEGRRLHDEILTGDEAVCPEQFGEVKTCRRDVVHDHRICICRRVIFDIVVWLIL